MKNVRKPIFFDRKPVDSPFGEYNTLLNGEWGTPPLPPPPGKHRAVHRTAQGLSIINRFSLNGESKVKLLVMASVL